MNQYVIVSFLEKDFPKNFLEQNWPIHVTIIRPFSSSKSDEEFSRTLTTICTQTKPIHTVGKSKEMFGPNNDVSVTTLENTSDLQSFHDQVMDALRTWIEFKMPQYKIYRPHVTDQATGGVSIGQAVTINSVSLVEMDSEGWRVMGTINF